MYIQEPEVVAPADVVEDDGRSDGNGRALGLATAAARLIW
jgi:hypothetical protein